MSAKVIDTTGHYTTQQGYGCTSTYLVNGRLVRTEVLVDAYAKQSHARVKLLSKLDTWEPLAEFPATAWHDGAPSYANRTTAAAGSFGFQLEEKLAARADRITGAMVS